MTGHSRQHSRRGLIAATLGLAGGLGVGLCGGGGTSAQIQVPSVACTVADSNMTLDLYMPLAMDGSGVAATTGMTGSLEIHHSKVPKQRRRWSLDGRQPSHFWNLGSEMRLRLILAPGEELIDLVIETANRQGDGVYAGNFRLQTAEGVRVTGRLQCYVG
jgi:hypothetical protein